MYKVFFKDRTLFLTDKLEQDLSQNFDALHKYTSHHELQIFINTFENNTSLKEAYVYGRRKEVLLNALKKCYRFITAAGGLVINPNNEFLVIHRLGVYDLPKGKCEKDESYRKTALREVEEECGITDLVIRHPLLSTFHTYEQKGVHYLKETAWFFMDYFGFDEPSPQTEENIVSATWVKKEAINEILNHTYPSIREVFAKAGY
ncbi:NUDIX domain-containing protein [Carboxylicivirga sediminis]|uniref:NUDIX domain-containing protein n=1 Tax=Carboxylicivirga sediminis TaxID=2006564 RepID=A0A941IUD6_9BACT|nr:NUDIX domain-containing protein [Carboxylicivirga sediminis]MBR8534721.1 NUDIX domain-containing protein [Carboxylicivirga sediminis]